MIEMDVERPDFERRFGGIKRLYGAVGLAKLQAAHVVVIGIGGVGSWAAEALARNAIGMITLVDLDNIAESNVNRQIHALDGNFGKAKITAMRERILEINPNCVVREIEDFVTVDNASKMLDFHFDVLVDCIDDAAAKAVLAALCKAINSPIIMSGSAGGRLDPTRIKVADLNAVTNDKLLAKVRNLLRRDYQFPRASNNQKSAKFNVTCVYSDEPTLMPDDAENTSCEVDNNTNNNANSNALQPNGPDHPISNSLHEFDSPCIHGASGDVVNTRAITGLNCAGYGSSVCVTAPFGFAAASSALQSVLNLKNKVNFTKPS